MIVIWQITKREKFKLALFDLYLYFAFVRTNRVIFEFFKELITSVVSFRRHDEVTITAQRVTESRSNVQQHTHE